MSLAVPNQTHDRTQEPASGHAHEHGHSHGHSHDHEHAHEHAHGPRRASPGLSLLRMSSLQRLAIAFAFVAAIWLGVFWAWA